MSNFYNITNYTGTTTAILGELNISDFTLNLMVKPSKNVYKYYNQSTSGNDCTNNNSYIFGSSIPASENAGMALVVGKNAILVGCHKKSYAPFLASIKCTIADWSFVTIVVKDSTPYIYLNGALIKTGKKCTNGKLIPPLELLAKHWVNNNSQFLGGLKNITLFNRVLTQEEINEITSYKVRLSDYNDDIIYHLPLEEGSGHIITDVKNNVDYDVTIEQWGNDAPELTEKPYDFLLLKDNDKYYTVEKKIDSEEYIFCLKEVTDLSKDNLINNYIRLKDLEKIDFSSLEFKSTNPKLVYITDSEEAFNKVKVISSPKKILLKAKFDIYFDFPYDEAVDLTRFEMIDDISLNYINSKSDIKYLLSLDSGTTWNTLFNNNLQEVDISQDIEKLYDLAIDSKYQYTESEFLLLNKNKKIRFLFIINCKDAENFRFKNYKLNYLYTEVE